MIYEKLFVKVCIWEIQEDKKTQEKKECLKLSPSRVAWRVFVRGNRGEKIRKKNIHTQKFQHIEYRTQKGEKR